MFTNFLLCGALLGQPTSPALTEDKPKPTVANPDALDALGADRGLAIDVIPTVATNVPVAIDYASY